MAGSESAWARWDSVIRDPNSTPLDVLRAVGTYQRYLAAVEDQAVKTARALGHTWEEIGRALGVSRQAAWERFRRPDRLETALDWAARTRWQGWGTPHESPFYYLVVSKAAVPVCVLWCGEHSAGVYALPGREADAEPWRGLQPPTETSPQATLQSWAASAPAGYEASAVSRAESFREVLADLGRQQD